MAARGAESKQKITETILNTFENSFAYDKEIRIPLYENGELIQIKVTLTAAKVNVDNPAGDSAVTKTEEAHSSFNVEPTIVEPTEAEKATLEDLMTRLGL